MRTNNTPMMDICTLVKQVKTKRADGYSDIEIVENEVFCGISEGVSRTEFYEASKAGIQLNATAQIWEDDYSGETELIHEDTKYEIVRVYPTGSGTLELSLREVVRGD